MTKQKTFKRRVRARMDKTGESYTAARRMLIAGGDSPETPSRGFEPPVPEESVVKATGHGFEHWFGLLDEWGAVERSHTEIARWLMDEHEVAGWWAQSVTLSYERARGRRAPGQRANGFAISASKTVAVPAERLFDAFEDESLRERWLPGADLSLRKATAPRIAHYDWEDGSTRVHVYIEERAADKGTVTVEHERLPDAETADEMKAWWRERVAALKPLLENGAAR